MRGCVCERACVCVRVCVCGVGVCVYVCTHEVVKSTSLVISCKVPGLKCSIGRLF